MQFRNTCWAAQQVPAFDMRVRSQAQVFSFVNGSQELQYQLVTVKPIQTKPRPPHARQLTGPSHLHFPQRSDVLIDAIPLTCQPTPQVAQGTSFLNLSSQHRHSSHKTSFHPTSTVFFACFPGPVLTTKITSGLNRVPSPQLHRHEADQGPHFRRPCG